MNAAAAVNGREKGARKRNQFVKRHTCYTERKKLIEVLAIAKTPPLWFRGIRAYFISRRMRRDARQLAQSCRQHTSALRLSNPRCSYFCSFKSDCNYSWNQRSKRRRLFCRVSRALTLPCDRWLCSRHRRFFDSLLLISGLALFS